MKGYMPERMLNLIIANSIVKAVPGFYDMMKKTQGIE